MRNALSYICYVLAIFFLVGSPIMSRFQSNAMQQLPYSITFFAIFIRCAIILGEPKDGIVFWKRLLCGIGKTLLSVLLAALISSLFANYEQIVFGWLFGLFMILSICFLQSSRVLGWFKKNQVNEAELPITQAPEDIEKSVVEQHPKETNNTFKKEFDISIATKQESKESNSKIISMLKRKNVILWITSMLCCMMTIPFAASEINSLYLIFAILTLGIYVWAILYEVKQVTDQAKNKRAFILFQYMAWSLFAEYTIHLIVIIPNLPLGNYDFENLSIFLCIFFGYLCLVRIPIMIYTYKRIFKEGDRFYLLPQWLIRFVNSYAESEASMRAMLAFIIYPLFYLCTFPAGIFFLFYLFPAIIIYIIVLFVIWVIQGNTKQINQ